VLQHLLLSHGILQCVAVFAMRYCVLLYVAACSVCCCLLHSPLLPDGMLQCIVVCGSVLQCVAVCCCLLQCVAVVCCSSVLQCVAQDLPASALYCIAVRCNALQ